MYSIARKIITLVLFIFLIGLAKPANAQNVVPDEIEKDALLAIYNNTNGANWALNKRWTLSKINSFPDSALVGVTISNGDIESLYLSNAGLNGTLPTEINNLTELQSLEASLAVLHNDSVPYLGNLLKLRVLNLSSTGIKGKIPTWLPQLINLQSISFSGNSGMYGPIPEQISLLNQLTSLSLSSVNLNMENGIPASLMDISALQSLLLANCNLRPESVPLGINGLNNLRTLDLSANLLFVDSVGVFADLMLNLPSLTALALRSNNLRKLPAHFDELTSLNSLDLNYNNFSDSSRLSDVIDTLQEIGTLKMLQMISCQIKELPENFGNLTSLNYLYLQNNALIYTACEPLGKLTELIGLNISSNAMTGFPDSIIDLTKLETLDASNNKLYPLPVNLKDIPHLKIVNLSTNGIVVLPAWFGTVSMPTITQLQLDNNKITLPLPDSLAQMTNLITLTMSQNKMEGILPDYFSGFTKLTTLNLSYNLIASPLPDMSQYTSLSYINFQSNNLIGAVPATLSNIPVYKNYVNLSFNKLDTLPAFHSSTSMTVIVNNNRLNFSNILKVEQPIYQYLYIPQDTATSLGGQPPLISVYEGDTLNITASIDRGTQPSSEYQWFKYVDGVNDIPLTSAPSVSGYSYSGINFSPSDEGKYYYKVTNPAVPGLTVKSPMITVKTAPCRTNAVMDFTYSRYVCAYIFNPPANSTKCRAIAYHWNFGDNTSSASKTPVHGYQQAGTYTVSLRLTFRCGTVCQSDTTFQKQVVFNPDEEVEVFKDSVIQITSDVRNNIIATSVSTFSDAWMLQYMSAATKSMNSFLNATQGVWRNDATYAYKVPRVQSAATSIATDGTFAMQQFNWQQSDLDAIPDWIKANTMTQYSPFSFELENRDVLGVYSAALYDYGGHLPSANGVNMRNNEMAFTSFEYFDNKVSGNWMIGTPLLPAYTTYKVKSGFGNMALIEADYKLVKEAVRVDVKATAFAANIFQLRNRFNYLADDSVICRQPYQRSSKLTALVIQDAPYKGIWTGQVMIKSELQPTLTPTLDYQYAHSGQSSLRITSEQTYKQGLIVVDSAKSYVMSAWVSVGDPNALTPVLPAGLGIDFSIRTRKGILDTTFHMTPSGPVIEGWQQIKGTFTSPINNAQLEITFKSGSSGQGAWFDDLRLHPEKGNMKSYVYNLDDYRLQATLDEENFASFYYYDKEGNLHLVKKETTEGIKTISENSNYQKYKKP